MSKLFKVGALLAISGFGYSMIQDQIDRQSENEEKETTSIDPSRIPEEFIQHFSANMFNNFSNGFPWKRKYDIHQKHVIATNQVVINKSKPSLPVNSSVSERRSFTINPNNILLTKEEAIKMFLCLPDTITFVNRVLEQCNGKYDPTSYFNTMDEIVAESIIKANGPIKGAQIVAEWNKYKELNDCDKDWWQLAITPTDQRSIWTTPDVIENINKILEYCDGKYDPCKYYNHINNNVPNSSCQSPKQSTPSHEDIAGTVTIKKNS